MSCETHIHVESFKKTKEKFSERYFFLLNSVHRMWWGPLTIEHDSDVTANSKTGRLSKASDVIYELRCS